MRGGTSRALFFHQRDLSDANPPQDCNAWDPLFMAALGTPDPNGRQLDGMGGGISSLSKVAVVGPSTRPDADVDYTFGQVAISESVVGYRGNCGNISSAVGPFAIDEGLVTAPDGIATVRIHNTNTGKIIVSSFPVANGKAVVKGDFVLQGIAGSGAEIRLAFLDPGGAATGRLLPTGRTFDTLDIPSLGRLEVSIVDAANPTVFLLAGSIGLSGTETPDVLSNDKRSMQLFEEIRVAAAVAMALVSNPNDARTKLKNLPLVGLLARSKQTTMANGERIDERDFDVILRMISSGQPHKATPLTGAMCLSVASQIRGTLAQTILRTRDHDKTKLRIAHPSGILSVAARVRQTDAGVVAEEVVVYRTARRLMEGRVLVPAL
jgi:hypothetical protein